MRQKLIIANWKMNLDAAAAQDFAARLRAARSGVAAVELAVCPAFPYLAQLSAALRDADVAVGAQDVFPEPAGAFTGEVSVSMLRDVGCTLVLIGHSERRHTVAHEDDWLLNRKLRAALGGGLRAVLCIGETLAQRDAQQTLDVLTFQLSAGLSGLQHGGATSLIIAYEPVWAIGTGRNATAAQAQEAHRHIRAELRRLGHPAEQMRVLYGGSLKPDNAAELFAQPDVDGGLIGGASLQAASFLEIAHAAS